MDHPLDSCIQCGAIDEGDLVDGYCPDCIERNRADFEQRKAWEKMTPAQRAAAIRDAARD